MRILDLFSGAGGCARGYADAGFEVVGVDIHPQPRYPYEFVQANALTYPLDGFDVIHASPPCQHYSPLNALAPDKTYPDYVALVRDRLMTWGGPWIIENVMSAPLVKASSVVLCGSMFGLRTYRHRRFELSPDLAHVTAPTHPAHLIPTATKQRKTRWDEGWNVSVTGDVGVYVGIEAMGIDWMNGNELCEAIPPAYTAHIGAQIL